MEKKIITDILSKVAEVELVYRSKVKPSERPQVASSKDAYEILIAIWEEGKLNLVEQFKVLFLNRANKVLCLYNLSTGGITGTVADPRLIFSAALKVNAVSLVLCHNHPSGALKPSRQDEELTQKIKGAGMFLDMKVLDHLIVSSERYFSFADEGLL
ncbi:JAB domain-containing protein [Flavisolibacter nicotianae]|uniref:JAB domain-containing protein n=1 Tax=Flavisolibacter nicotianae TaxID=2364882 RepID=UPI000EB0A621|nr:JAB domain-containing protein [Flavisolibacter nicotianae]